MEEYTEFEIGLLKLTWVYARLDIIYRKFSKITQEPIELSDKKETERFLQIIRETIILQFDTFNKIRNNLNKEPEIRKIDPDLKPLWNPIKKIEKGINKYRDKYIAHVQQSPKRGQDVPFEIMADEIMINYNIPRTFGYWMFLSGCVSKYFDFVILNFKKEWDEACRKYNENQEDKLKDKPHVESSINLQNYQLTLDDAVNEVKNNLKQNGFKFKTR